MFSGGGAEVADLVRQRMRSLYASDLVPAYLNAPAQGLLDEARASYRRLAPRRTGTGGLGCRHARVLLARRQDP